MRRQCVGDAAIDPSWRGPHIRRRRRIDPLAAAAATALILMRAAAIDGSGLAPILDRTERQLSAGSMALPSYLATHPPSAHAWPSRPALDESEWRARSAGTRADTCAIPPCAQALSDRP